MTGATQGDSSVGNRFMFTGREWIAAASLYDYRNRVYSVELGRFVQTDPILFAGGDVNLYGYVGNGPIRFIDPLGLDWLDSTLETMPGLTRSITDFEDTNHFVGSDTFEVGMASWGGLSRFGHSLASQYRDDWEHTASAGMVGGSVPWAAGLVPIPGGKEGLIGKALGLRAAGVAYKNPGWDAGTSLRGVIMQKDRGLFGSAMRDVTNAVKEGRKIPIGKRVLNGAKGTFKGVATGLMFDLMVKSIKAAGDAINGIDRQPESCP